MDRVTLSRKPSRKTDEVVYSNLDHLLEEDVAAQLAADPGLCAQHAAWNFCGWVWHANGVWYEEVWRFKELVAVLSGLELAALITDVNGKYGAE